ASSVSILEKNPKVVFVLGGPGSGKGTQCTNIAKLFGYTHLSAGDLLRAESESDSENGIMIKNVMKEGKIVLSEVTDKFLIDGFPCNDENRAAFENVTGIEPAFVLYFDCSVEEMERRLLNRNQAREDDKIETIKKQFKIFLESNPPVISYYGEKRKNSQGLLHNFMLPCLKWETQCHLCCMKVPSPNAIEDRRSLALRKPRKRQFDVSVSTDITRGLEKRIQFDLKTETDRMKDAILRKEAVAMAMENDDIDVVVERILR
ncbi:hypothetical protein S83_039962, partial [Arachis hypogaea]